MRQLKKGVLYKIYISYVLILGASILINVIININTLQVAKSEAQSVNQAIIKQLSSVMDQKLLDLIRFCNAISADKVFEELASQKLPETVFEKYNYIQTYKDSFVTYGAINSFVNNFYIYFGNGNFVVSSGTFNLPKEAYTRYHSGMDISYESWFSLINKNHISTLLTVNGERENDKQLLFLKSVEIKGNDVTFVIDIDLKRISEIIDSTKWSGQSDFMIINEKDVVFYMGQHHKAINVSEFAKNKKGYYVTEIQKEKYYTFYETSNILNCKYVIMLPQSLVMNNIYNVIWVTILLVIINLILGLILSYVQSNKQFRPIQNIASSLNFEEMSSEYKHDEYEHIIQSIKQLVQNNNEYSAKINSQIDILKNEVLLKYLNGDYIDKEDFERKLLECGYNFDTRYFMLLVLKIQDTGDVFNAEKDLNLAMFAVKNVVNELVGEINTCYFANKGSSIIVLVSVKEENKAKQEADISRCLDKIYIFFKENFNLETFIYKSGIFERDEVVEIYKTTISDIEYAIAMNYTGVNMSQDFYMLKDENLYSWQDENKMINIVESGDFQEVERYINLIFERINSYDKHSVNTFKYISIRFATTIVRLLENLNHNEKDILYKKAHVIDNMTKCKSFSDMHRYLLEMVSTICKYKADSKDMRTVDLFVDILNFINTNISNPRLDATMVANHFNISTGHLSRLFKANLNEGMVTYITNCRVEMAKDILLSEDITIEETAARVGYNNSLALARAFRKTEGITPAKFKEIH